MVFLVYMAGHSKWANIKHTKGVADAKRGKLFTKLAKEITVAAKLGGGDTDANPRLRRAIQAARDVSMPKDNISRAIKRGTGDLEGVSYEEVTFEGYGPAGVAVLVDCLTDNRNRTVSDIRFLFSKGNGNMGEVGCVNWMFDHRGEFIFEKDKVTNMSQLQDMAIEAGAVDIVEDEESLTVYSEFEDYDKVREFLDEKDMSPQRASLTKIPQNTVTVEGENAENVLKLIELLEENDDVQNVYCNFELSDKEMKRLLGGNS